MKASEWQRLVDDLKELLRQAHASTDKAEDRAEKAEAERDGYKNAYEAQKSHNLRSAARVGRKEEVHDER